MQLQWTQKCNFHLKDTIYIYMPLTHFKLFYFFTHWKHLKTTGFLFSGGMEMEH